MNGYGKVQYSGVTDADIRGRQMDELIRKKDALDALMAERKHLLANGQKGAEHVLTHHGYNVIDELKPVQSDVPDIYAGKLISRQAALDAIHCDITVTGRQNAELVAATIGAFADRIKALPTVQPTITHEQAIDYLHKTGWLQNHDRILTESKIVPPVHGEWIDTETSYADGVQQKCRCSVCKLLSPRPLGDFCRWCGADMRGEADEQN